MWMTSCVLGSQSNLEWLFLELTKECTVTKTFLSYERCDVRESTFLNRVIALRCDGISIEGDPTHVNILVNAWHMQQSNTVDTPMTGELAQVIENIPLMHERERESYRERDRQRVRQRESQTERDT